ncbi:MAG: hypothetical protein RLZZ592_2065 [Pseudomonadota bacterium]|jgi:PAS domain S-box-containing protein
MIARPAVAPGRRSDWLLRWPARVLLPLLLLSLALVVTLLGHQIRLVELETGLMQAERQRLVERLALEQGRLAQVIGRGEMAQVRRLVAGMALHEGLMQAWLVEPDGRILGAFSRAETGRRLSTVLIALPPLERDGLLGLLQRVRAELLVEPAVAPDGTRRLLLGAVRIEPDRTLLVRADLGHVLAVRQAQARADLLRQFFFTLLGVSLFGLLLHLLWFRRTDQLHRTAMRLAQGDLSARTGLKGADELALIGRAVDRMATELQLRQAELQQLADHIAHSPVVVITWRNAEGWPVRQVGENIQLWGHSREDLLSGRVRYARLIHPEDLDRVSLDVSRHLAVGPDEYRQEYRLRHGDGHWMWIEDRTWLAREPNGSVRDIHGVLLDVTELHAARAELALQVRRLREAEAHARLGSWSYDVEHGRGWWSAQMFELFGIDPARGVPSFEDFVAQAHEQDQAAVRQMLQAFAQGVPPERATVLFRRHPDLGPVRWFSVTIHPETCPDGQVRRFIGTVLDVTDTRLAEEALRHANLELEQRVEARTRELTELNQSLESFVYTVSHDLKAPLRGVEGYTRLLLEDHAESLGDEGRLFARRIQEGTRRMGHLIDDLLAYARMERRALSIQDLDLGLLVRQILEESGAEIARTGAVLEVEVPEGLQVRADPEGLRLALRNLLANALKFSASRTPPRLRLSARLVQAEDSPPGQAGDIALSLSDNGIGFDMAYHDRIFEIFQRLQRMEDYPGTGIGLALVRKAMQRMGGQVRATSAPDQGATFVLTLRPGSPAGGPGAKKRDQRDGARRSLT